MRFGTYKKDVIDNDGAYLRTFKKGDTRVRFLTEIEDWVQFREHYSVDGKSFPCTKDRSTCPGCTDENEKVSRSTNRYAVNAILVKNGQVYAFKMGKSLVDRLSMRSERNGGTIVNRDYVIIRSGDGLETDYDVEQEDKSPVNLKEYKDQLVNIEEVLEANFNEAFGDEEKPAKKAAKPRKDDDDDDTPVARASKRGSWKDEEEEVPPSKPAAAKSAAKQEEDDEDFSEDDIRKMKRPELLDLYAKAGIDADDDMSTRELAEFLISKFGN